MWRVLLLFLLLTLSGWAQPAGDETSSVKLSLTHTPLQGEKVKITRPVLTVYLPLGSNRKGDAKMWLDEQEVSDKLSRTAAFVSFEPRQELTPGNHTVRFNLGKVEVLSWSFQVEVPEHIRQVSWTGPASLQDFDEVAIELEGQAGATARFQVEGVSEKLPMKEDRPGHYVAKYTVTPGVIKVSAHLLGELSGPGYSEIKPAKKNLRFTTSGFRIDLIQAPPADEPVYGELHLQGRTRAGVKVSVRSDYLYTDGIEVISAKSGPLPKASETRVATDQAGIFVITVPRPTTQENLILNVSIEAEDADGNRSQKLLLHYHSWQKPPTPLKLQEKT